MRYVPLVITFSILFLARDAVAQWQPDGVAISTASVHGAIPPIPMLVSDGVGGMIVTWDDNRSGTNHDIYVQRVDAFGVPQWTPDGVAICIDEYGQFSPNLVSDGSGGAIMVWYDRRSATNYDVYAQRVNSAGAPQWTENGVPLCTAANDQLYPTLISDDAAGAIVTWQDRRSGTYKVYAQRVNALGAPQWIADGVPLRAAATSQQSPVIAWDGVGGAIITWEDLLTGSNIDILAQHVDASGALQWNDGIALCTATYDQRNPKIAPDGSGGAIVNWEDQRSETSYDIYAQRVGATGTPVWNANGVALCIAAGDQQTGNRYNSPIASDGTGGAIVAWADRRSGTDYDLYAQSVDAAGIVQWAADGVAVCTSTNDNGAPAIISDGVGGAIVSWDDTRNDLADIYAQRVDVSGASQWTADGVVLCAAGNNQFVPKLVSDGAGGAIATWSDCRGNETYHVYAQRVSFGGMVPTAIGHTPSPPALALTPNFPNPFSGATTMDLALTTDAAVRIDVFDVAGRRVRAIELGSVVAGSRRMVFDGLGDDGRVLPSGVYFYRVQVAGNTITRKMVIAR